MIPAMFGGGSKPSGLWKADHGVSAPLSRGNIDVGVTSQLGEVDRELTLIQGLCSCLEYIGAYW